MNRSYLTHLGEVASSCALAPRLIPRALGDAGDALADLFHALVGIVLMLVMPLALPLAPLFALLSMRAERKEAETRARLRRGMHQNGSAQ